MLDAANDASAGDVGVGSQVHEETPADEAVLIRGVRHDTALFLGNLGRVYGQACCHDMTEWFCFGKSLPRSRSPDSYRMLTPPS